MRLLHKKKSSISRDNETRASILLMSCCLILLVFIGLFTRYAFVAPPKRKQEEVKEEQFVAKKEQNQLHGERLHVAVDRLLVQLEGVDALDSHASESTLSSWRARLDSMLAVFGAILVRDSMHTYAALDALQRRRGTSDRVARMLLASLKSVNDGERIAAAKLALKLADVELKWFANERHICSSGSEQQFEAVNAFKMRIRSLMLKPSFDVSARQRAIALIDSRQWLSDVEAALGSADNRLLAMRAELISLLGGVVDLQAMAAAHRVVARALPALPHDRDICARLLLDIDALRRDIVAYNDRVALAVAPPPLPQSTRRRLAFLVPVRDRRAHERRFLAHMLPLIDSSDALGEHAHVIFAEQSQDGRPFNRGKLLNVAAREAAARGFTEFALHDVDMVPLARVGDEPAMQRYRHAEWPRHVATCVEQFNFTMPYERYAGGVIVIGARHFVAANGFSSLRWGWGGEDDDFASRLEARRLHLRRDEPHCRHSRYRSLPHQADERANLPIEERPGAIPCFNKFAKRFHRSLASIDGLNSLHYSIERVDLISERVTRFLIKL
jgi:N-terminal domain of galactosyltransferase/N-terminal region of glycosyl transferase group 7